MKQLTLILTFLLFTFLLSGQEQKLIILSDTASDKSITKKTFEMQEVEVKAKFKSANIKSGSTGISVDINEIKMLPKLVGEVDPYKALQFMGGVSQAGEANSGLYVRGGNNDQNLILLNGSVIQNPTHVLGIFSIFNPDLIDRMKFIKSGIPAEYGGRLSSVVDISAGNNYTDKLKIDGSVGLISSKLAIQAPLTSNISVYGSLRGSYISSIILPALTLVGLNSEFTENKYEFWDANAGFNLRLSEKSRLSGHFYSGKDYIKIMQFSNITLDENTTFWKNTTAGLEYYYLFSDNFSMRHQLNFSGFNIQSNINWFNSNNSLTSSFDNFTYKTEFLKISGNHNFRFGSEVAYHLSYPHFLRTDSIIPIDLENQHNNIFSGDIAVFVRDEFEIQKWLFNIGLRASAYAHFGEYTDYINNVAYDKNQIVKSYGGIEPRFFTRYLINTNSSVKISASRHYQYLNQIPVFSLGIPADLQIPAGLFVKPQKSWHFSGGFFQNLKNNDWELSWELYYKTLENQLEFKSSIASIFTNGNIDQNLLTGKGYSYGSEWKIRKNSGKFTGWLTYNLAWSYRQFDEINNGEPFLATNDRRHDISLIGMYELNKKWSFSALFVYATGSKLNLPVSWFIVDNKVIMEYGKYNSFEMPAYHRLDLSATLKLKEKKNWHSELNFSIYNVYNRANPYQVFYSTKAYSQRSFDFDIKMSYLLPIIPSISYSFHF